MKQEAKRTTEIDDKQIEHYINQRHPHEPIIECVYRKVLYLGYGEERHSRRDVALIKKMVRIVTSNYPILCLHHNTE